MFVHITKKQLDQLLPWMTGKFHPACIDLLTEHVESRDHEFDLDACFSDISELDGQSLFLFEPIHMEEEGTDWGEVWGFIITKDDVGYRMDSVEACGDDSHFVIQKRNGECDCDRLLLMQYRIREFLQTCKINSSWLKFL